MLLLAIDSATPVAGVALWGDGRILREEYSDYKQTHSRDLMPMVDRILGSCRVDIEEISALGVSIGPGSFTGLRIGLATVKGLAMAANLPVVGISTLEMMAHNFAHNSALVCPLLDARKNEVYTAFFDVHSSYPRRLSKDLFCSPSEFVEIVKEQRIELNYEKVILLGNGYTPYSEYFQNELGEEYALAPAHLMYPRAGALASLAVERVIKEEFDDARTLKPVYVRLSEAEYQLGKEA